MVMAIVVADMRISGVLTSPAWPANRGHVTEKSGVELPMAWMLTLFVSREEARHGTVAMPYESTAPEPVSRVCLSVGEPPARRPVAECAAAIEPLAIMEHASMKNSSAGAPRTPWSVLGSAGSVAALWARVQVWPVRAVTTAAPGAGVMPAASVLDGRCQPVSLVLEGGDFRRGLSESERERISEGLAAFARWFTHRSTGVSPLPNAVDCSTVNPGSVHHETVRFVGADGFRNFLSLLVASSISPRGTVPILLSRRCSVAMDRTCPSRAERPRNLGEE